MSAPKFTPGPWGWFGSAKRGMYLATLDSGRTFVMDFVRQGMEGAQPRFQRGNVMEKAAELAVFEVAPHVVGVTAAKREGGVYRDDIIAIDHPDARLIAAAPELYEALSEILKWADPYALPNCGEHEADVACARMALAKARGES